MRTAVAVALSLTAVAASFSTGYASAAPVVSGFVEADSGYVSYGKDLAKGRNASLYGDISADVWKGIGVEGYARQVTAGTREDLSVHAGHKFGPLSAWTQVGHAHYDVGNMNSDKNYFKAKLGYNGLYGLVERDWGVRSVKPSVDYYTVGYTRALTARLKLGVEATEKNYRFKGVSRFNDVALTGSYKVTQHLSAVAVVAKAFRDDNDVDQPGASSIGVRYTF